MVLESTIVCADTSEFMRNGDFVPTRIQAQQDAVNLVCLSKTKSNPENNVGLITMSPVVKVLVTMTTEVERILATLHQVQPEGPLQFLTGIKIAHLALKHRQGKNHRMRIVAFVGSPIENDEKELVKLAKKLKKEKVSVDIINFGQDAENTEKLTTFVNTINGSEGTGSHLVTIPPGTLLSDALMHSPVIVGEDGSGAVPGLPGSSGGEFEFGFDPASDPELAMALRISMEEQRQRQEDETKQVIEDTAGEPTPKPTTTVAVPPSDSEEALLEQALAMSMNPEGGTSSAMEETPIPDFSTMTEEEQIAYAMQMSLAPEDKETPMETEAAGGSKPEGAKAESGTVDYEEVMSDPNFLRSVLENLPGVDPSSETVQNAMGSLLQRHSKEENQEKKKKEEKDKDEEKKK